MPQVAIRDSGVPMQSRPARSSLILDSLSHTGRWAGHTRQVCTVGSDRVFGWQRAQNAPTTKNQGN